MNKKLISSICILSVLLFFACGSPKEDKSTTDSSSTGVVAEQTESRAAQSDVPDVILESDNNEGAENSESNEDTGVPEEVAEEPIPIEQITKADIIISTVTMANVDAVDSKKLFRMHCAICHGFKGDMKINGAKDLSKSKIPLNQSIAQIYFGKGLMTPYKDILSEAEIVAMAKYTETLRK